MLYASLHKSKSLAWAAMFPLAALPLSAQAQGLSNPAPGSPEQILAPTQVEAAPLTDTEERRFSNLTRAVYGQEELQRFGDEPVTEVLKRLPGVSLPPGRGGSPRLRGLGGGYTQVLINGEPAPRGFSLDSIPADQVSQVEVLRSPSAEFSAQSIAGTINIVLAEGARADPIALDTSVSLENGEITAGVSARAPVRHERIEGSLRVGLRNRNDLDETQRSTTAQASDGSVARRDTQNETLAREVSSAILGGQLRWLGLPNGIRLSLQPFLLDSHAASLATSQTEVGGQGSPFALQTTRTESRFSLARLQSTLTVPMAQGSSFVLASSLRISENQSESRQVTEGAVAGATMQPTAQPTAQPTTAPSTRQRNTNTRSTNVGLNLKPKWTLQRSETSRWVYGAEVDYGSNRDRRQVSETTATSQASMPIDAASTPFNGDTLLAAGFVQWETDLHPRLGIAPGLRFERLDQSVKAGSLVANNVSQVLSPIFNTVFRLDPESKDQVRLGLSRTYKAPSLSELNPTLSLSGETASGMGNSALQPDSVGNPALRPELAWGVDLAYEHYLPTDGLLSASVFLRDIEDVIQTVTRLQSVDYSPSPRFVRRPENFGRARAYGLELEAKLKAKDLSWVPGLAQALPGLELRASTTRQVSEIQRIPGPDNRLADQPSATYGLGVDTPLPGTRWKLGLNYALTPAQDFRRPNNESQRQGIRRTAEFTAFYRESATLGYRLTLAQWLPNDIESLRTRDDGLAGNSVESSRTKSNLLARLQLEMKF